MPIQCGESLLRQKVAHSLEKFMCFSVAIKISQPNRNTKIFVAKEQIDISEGEVGGQQIENQLILYGTS